MLKSTLNLCLEFKPNWQGKCNSTHNWGNMKDCEMYQLTRVFATKMNMILCVRSHHSALLYLSSAVNYWIWQAGTVSEMPQLLTNDCADCTFPSFWMHSLKHVMDLKVNTGTVFSTAWIFQISICTKSIPFQNILSLNQANYWIFPPFPNRGNGHGQSPPKLIIAQCESDINDTNQCIQ